MGWVDTGIVSEAKNSMEPAHSPHQLKFTSGIFRFPSFKKFTVSTENDIDGFYSP